MLREHPDVFVPPNKGTFFFSRHYHKGIDWYERFFARAAHAAVGEVCEDYLASAEALSRINEYDPGMLLICCLRNPYERAISSWRFFARNGHDEPTLAAQAARNSQVFADGCYATQLRVARSLFADKQILIFLFEDLAADPRSVTRRLYRFIGVDPEFVPPSLHRRINGSSRPRSRLLARVAHDIHIRSWGASRIASNAIGRLKRVRPLRRLVQTALYTQEQYSRSWRDLICEFPRDVIDRYEHEISGLELLLRRDLSDWHAQVPPTASHADELPSSSFSC